MERKIVNIYVMKREHCNENDLENVANLLNNVLSDYKVIVRRCSLVVPNLLMIRVEVPFAKDVDTKAIEQTLLDKGFVWVKTELVVIK